MTEDSVEPDYISLRAIKSEERAWEVAAAFHAALHGLRQLCLVVPGVSGRALILDRLADDMRTAKQLGQVLTTVQAGQRADRGTFCGGL
ncbi:hypothetical protein GCM10010259_08780 [Streptomyces daghestanicus]|uniref:Uncharacterized protein n=1 Tax=Streptomyces daghestanicus TaxID=66885 RepID=A0ABQ3Q2U3_9ACTN|nr:hypothetical protein GCM10010259_08780 [Streptomyces daghestanicus]GHI31566.1 hypothetical protein Sdagh_32960 [Streptomyces daghestanicus]